MTKELDKLQWKVNLVEKNDEGLNGNGFNVIGNFKAYKVKNIEVRIDNINPIQKNFLAPDKA